MLIALGGNALIKKGQRGTAAEQFENLKEPISQIARLSKKYRIIITHGNCPRWIQSYIQSTLGDSGGPNRRPNWIYD